MKDLFIIRVPLCIVSWSFLDAFRKKDNTHYKPVIRRVPAFLDILPPRCYTVVSLNSSFRGDAKGERRLAGNASRLLLFYPLLKPAASVYSSQGSSSFGLNRRPFTHPIHGSGRKPSGCVPSRCFSHSSSLPHVSHQQRRQS